MEADAPEKVDNLESPDAPANPPEPRWPALVAVLAAGGLYSALPPYLAVGPQWLSQHRSAFITQHSAFPIISPYCPLGFRYSPR